MHLDWAERPNYRLNINRFYGVHGAEMLYVGRVGVGHVRVTVR